MTGINNIVEILDAVKLLVVTGKEVMKDGKVSVADLPAAMALLSQVQVLVKAVEGAELVIAEGKDLDAAEIAVLVAKVKDLALAVKA